MPRLILQADSGSGRIWVRLDGQRQVCLRDGDREGLKVITTWLVDSQIISAEEAVAELYQIKLANLERETILKRLLNQ